jgi:hypothetical protein
MSELWVRVLVVVGALAGVVLVAALLRRSARRGEALAGAGLSPGAYLFTSATCADCLTARDRLVERLGPSGFTEIEWEKDPGIFARVGIEMVPCTVLVARDGSATSYPGVPDEGALRGPSQTTPG